jgi:hypothetical protein
MNAPVIEYIVEEVRRQRHNVLTLDGIERVGWMADAWSYAAWCALGKEIKPILEDAIVLGKRVERVKNAQGLRCSNVRVGQRLCPPWERVPSLLKLLFEQRDALTPLEFYKAFEEIHPFVDGNGRTGKIVLNWLNGTLLDPIFPPADLWGYPILNP